MISIIVPVYNAVLYIEECIKSILCQSYNDYELILIDDGSTDGSGLICDEYAETDSRIKVIHQSNAGVSAARNTGINASHGEYISFVDADDWIDPQLINILVNRAQETGADIITSGIIWWHNSEKFMQEPLEDKYILDFSNESDLLYIVNQKLITSPCAKLYSNELIRDKGLVFDKNLSYGEDRDFNVRFLTEATLASTVSYIGYFYRRNLVNSLSAVKKGYDYTTDLSYWKKLYEMFGKRGFSANDTQGVLSHRLFYIVSDCASAITKDCKIMDAVKMIREMYKGVPAWNFLRKNANIINAPAMLKYLILYRMAILTSIYLKIR